MSGKCVGDISGTFCDKFGQEGNDTTIKNVTHMPNAESNFFSITKKLNKGYKLGGDSNLIWIKKDGNKVFFTSRF